MTHSTDKPVTRLLLIAVVAAAAVSLSGCSLIQQFTNQTPRDPSGQPTATNADANAFSIKVGDCLDDGDSSGTVTSVPIVPCTEPHDSEAYASIDLPNGDFPGDQSIQDQADTGCSAKFADFIGVPYNESELRYTYYFPSEDSWSEGDREILCEVYDPVAQTTGSLAGVQR